MRNKCTISKLLKFKTIQTLSTIIHDALLTAWTRSPLHSSIRPNRLTVGSGKFSYIRPREELRGNERRRMQRKGKSARLIKFIQEASSLYAFSAGSVEIGEQRCMNMHCCSRADATLFMMLNSQVLKCKLGRRWTTMNCSCLALHVKYGLTLLTFGYLIEEKSNPI